MIVHCNDDMDAQANESVLLSQAIDGSGAGANLRTRSSADSERRGGHSPDSGFSESLIRIKT